MILTVCQFANNDSYNGVDILLTSVTSEWPQGIFNFVTPPVREALRLLVYRISNETYNIYITHTHTHTYIYI